MQVDGLIGRVTNMIEHREYFNDTYEAALERERLRKETDEANYAFAVKPVRSIPAYLR